MRFKDEKSDCIVNFKATPTEKELIKQAADNRGMTVSEFLRYACERIFEGEKILDELD